MRRETHLNLTELQIFATNNYTGVPLMDVDIGVRKLTGLNSIILTLRVKVGVMRNIVQYTVLAVRV